MKAVFVLISAFAAYANAFTATELTTENYEDLTEGKTVFIMYYAPWCAHSKRQLPIWDQLAERWDGDEVVFIGKVDCTGEAHLMCDEHRIRGFPTLQWGDPSHPTTMTEYTHYDNGIDALDQYCKDHLKLICSINHLELCDEDQRAEIEKVMDLTDAELDELIKKDEAEIREAEEEFGKGIAELNAEHQRLLAEKDAKIREVREANLGLLKSVKAQIVKEAALDDL